MVIQLEGEFSFSVNVPVTETPAENKLNHKKEHSHNQMLKKIEVDTVNETKDEEIQQNKMPSYIIPSIIGVLIVIVVGSFLWLLRRKK